MPELRAPLSLRESVEGRGRLERAMPEAFLSDPRGRYVIGRSWVYFCATDGFAGSVVWGELTRRDAEEVVRIAPATTQPPMPPHGGMIDARRVTGVELGAFNAFRRYVESHWEAVGQTVRRIALIRPGGFVGAAALGLFQVAPVPYESRVFTTPGAGLGWLGREDDGLLDELDGIAGPLSGESQIVLRLRDMLETCLHEATPQQAARVLGMSVRSLQRQLKELGTSFSAELESVRLRVAQRLMSESDVSLSVVAQEVGFASQAGLTALFRKLVDEPPLAWRKRWRADHASRLAPSSRPPPRDAS